MFFTVIKDTVTKCFGKQLKNILGTLVDSNEEPSDLHMSKLYFGDFMIPDAFPREYDEVNVERCFIIKS
jgi:hypothetical protein